MTDKKYGAGVILNHTHPTKQEPIIHVHNTEPFETYEDAALALKKKIMHPGEIVVVYYKNASADDGISSVIATGPIEQGGYNEIFKNAEQIDDLAKSLRTAIETQDSEVAELAAQLKAEIIAEAEQLRVQTIADVSVIIIQSQNELENRVNSSLNSYKEEMNSRIENDVQALNSSINAIVDIIDDMGIDSGESKEEIDALKEEIKQLKEILGVENVPVDSSNLLSDLIEKVDDLDKHTDWRTLDSSSGGDDEGGDDSLLPFNAFWRDLNV